MYRIQQIKLRPDEPENRLKDKILKKLGRHDILITELRIVRKSIDARNRDDIVYVYTADFEAVYKKRPRELARLKCGARGGLEIAPDLSYHGAEPGDVEMSGRPVIAGFGPCGMFAALILAEAGYRPIVTERGKDADARSEDVEMFKRIHFLVKTAGLTLEGAARQLGEDTSKIDNKVKVLESLRRIRSQLEDIRGGL